MEIKANLITALTGIARASDLSELRLLSHAERVTYISFRLAQTMGLTHQMLNELVLSALLHDIGISTTQEKLQVADLEAKRNTIVPHCIRGYELLKPTSLFGHLAQNVLEHHDFHTTNQRLIPAIIHADRLDLALDQGKHCLLQVDRISTYFAENANKRFHPQVVRAFLELKDFPCFWLDLQFENYSILHNNLKDYDRLLSLAELEELAQLIAHLVDSKSPHTASHSKGVARIGALLAKKMGMAQDKIRLIKIAGLLHDLGKLSISDELLMHKGPLNDEQRAIIKQHAYHTYHLIGQIGPGVGPLQRWASYHHEHLDGTGYPFRLTAEDLETEARLLAVADLVQALLEARPYRAGLGQAKAIDILRANVKSGHIDGEITELAIANLAEIEKLI